MEKPSKQDDKERKEKSKDKSKEKEKRSRTDSPSNDGQLRQILLSPLQTLLDVYTYVIGCRH